MKSFPLRLAAVLALTLTAGTLTTAALTAAEPEAGFQWREDAEKGQTTLMHGDQPVITYMHAAYDDSNKDRWHETYKVYHHVYGPQSGERITKGPGGLYTHHRGLYVGWNKTTAGGTGYDFWHCTRGARQEHAQFIEKKAGPDGGTMTAEIHWNDADGQPVIRELRTVRVTRTPDDAWQIDWSSELHSDRGEIQLGGDRQHAGFQFRADQDVAEKNAARYIRPTGFPQQNEAFQVGDAGNPPKHIDLGWLAMTYPLHGKQYTVAYFEAPGQPTPSLYSERPYGRFGAFYKATLDEDSPLKMRYRLLVFEGETPTQEELAARYDALKQQLKSERPASK
jgi:hypothetical protein